jgi:drug/metabolite transporter (DMT)-like permease
MSSVVIKMVSTTGLVASLYRLWLVIPLLWGSALLLPSVRRGMTPAWWRASVVGGTLFGLHQILFFTSVKLTSVVNVTVIGALQPLLVLVVAGRVFAERVTGTAIVWALVAMAGTALVVSGSSGMPAWSAAGDILATLNLFAFTAYFLASKRLRADVGTTEYVVGMTSVAGVVVLGAAVISGEDLSPPATADVLILLGIALVPGTLGHLLTNWAHAHAPAFVMSIMLLAVPVIASAAAALFLGEALSLTQVAGGALVLAAIGRVLGLTRAQERQALASSAARTDAP